MKRTRDAIAYLDAPRLLRALTAGIGNVFQRREYLNRINVFPVPDGDTGTNMAFTFKTILEATASSPDERIDTSASTSCSITWPRPPSTARAATRAPSWRSIFTASARPSPGAGC
ncbi:MAG: hypothetical protein MUE63_13665 [Xanthomonadales bacterium]|nr:hypothetical protein [Xanthomonadales bacterium]